MNKELKQELEHKFDRLEQLLVERRDKVKARDEASVEEIADLIIERLRGGHVTEQRIREIIREELRPAVDPRRIRA